MRSRRQSRGTVINEGKCSAITKVTAYENYRSVLFSWSIRAAVNPHRHRSIASSAFPPLMLTVTAFDCNHTRLLAEGFLGLFSINWGSWILGCSSLSPPSAIALSDLYFPSHLADRSASIGISAWLILTRHQSSPWKNRTSPSPLVLVW